MSRTILAEVDGWTPVIDTVLQDTSPAAAVVFGRMWRYCQMKDGVCWATQETIATETGLSRQTVYEHIKTLEQKGYIEDLTPELRNKPHTYRDTGKAGLHLVVSGVKKLDSEKRPAVKELGSAVKNLDSQSQISLHEDSNKKELKKEEKQETNAHTHSFSSFETAQLKSEYMESNTATYRKAHVMLMNVSSLPAIPRDQEGYIDTVQAMVSRYGEQETKTALERACLKWISTQGKNGRNYSKTNFKWVDWAMDSLSGGGKPIDPAMKTHNELMAMIRGEA